MKRALLLLLGMGFAAAARAQSVNWNNPGPVVPNSVAQLELVFTDCQPQGNVGLPQVNGLQFLGQPGRATSFSMINFQTSSSTTLSYSVQVNQSGRIQIPAFEVQTDKGKKTVPSLAMDATAAAPPRQQAAPSPFPFPPGFFQNQPPPTGAAPVVPPSAVQAEAQAEPRNPFAGEVFDVNYRVMMGPGRSGRVKTTPLWDVQNFTAEAWDRGQQIGPGGSQGLQFHTRAMVPKVGKFELRSIRQKLDIDTPLGGRSFFFTAPGSVEVEASTEPVTLEVQPLPAGAPAGLKGAVGQFTLESRMVPEQVNEGEPITWTLSLKGTGNWPMGVELPSRTVPAKMRTIQPKLRREFDGTQVFTGGLVEDLVLIPTEAGDYELPAVKFVYFDPKKKAYETIEAKPPKISVLKQGTLRPAGPAQVTMAPAATPPQKPGGGPGWGGFGSGRQAKVLQYGTPALPREPLEGTGVGVGPIPTGWIRFLALLPWLVLGGVWWRWAQKRAALTDPERGRKEALQSWKSAVQFLLSGPESAEMREKSLLVWQKSVAGTLGVDAATPAWPEISAAAPTLQESDRADLEKFWLESDEALYGRDRSLNGDWCERAATLASRIDLPPLKVWEPLRPRNLLPWLGGLLILALPLSMVAEDKPVLAPVPQAEDPIRLYREGSFEKAGQIWGEAVRKDMTDPVSRNNLGLVPGRRQGEGFGQRPLCLSGFPPDGDGGLEHDDFCRRCRPTGSRHPQTVGGHVVQLADFQGGGFHVATLAGGGEHGGRVGGGAVAGLGVLRVEEKNLFPGWLRRGSAWSRWGFCGRVGLGGLWKIIRPGGGDGGGCGAAAVGAHRSSADGEGVSSGLHCPPGETVSWLEQSADAQW